MRGDSCALGADVPLKPPPRHVVQHVPLVSVGAIVLYKYVECLYRESSFISFVHACVLLMHL